MTFTGTGFGLLSLIYFYAQSVGAILLSADNIQFFDAPFSVLDVFVAFMLWELVVWFIIRLLTGENMTKEGYESEGAKYQQYGETGYTSALENEIDFSESIEHE